MGDKMDNKEEVIKFVKNLLEKGPTWFKGELRNEINNHFNRRISYNDVIRIMKSRFHVLSYDKYYIIKYYGR